MNKYIIKFLVFPVLIVALYYITLESLWYFIDKFHPTKNSIFLGIALYYGKIFFSIIVITSTFAWLIKIKVIRLLLISILFCIYLLNWYSSFFIYPYRISLLIIVSAIFYGILHLFLYKKMNKK
jgi:hypothetical protein